ncbi:FecR domain-containing protein [Brevundimonas sp.]|jgi:transmembrane sensor|uniref:FecR family protein n=1 Tax=Brevundimonas sp. TaxID=1871086 RepID=UPI0028A893D2|nr:FecR domain-containing protein [Brevundimonas sp.]
MTSGAANDDHVDPAAFWFARMNAGPPPSAEDQGSFRLWLDADPANIAGYRRCQQTWRMLELDAGEPEILALRAAALGRGRPSVSRRAIFGLAGGAVAACCGGVWFLGAASPARALILTKAGQRLTATLPDGSEAVLAPLTRLQLDFADGRRAAVLEQGQVYLNLSTDADRPFALRAGNRVLTADGGRFQLTLNDNRPDVVVEQGALTVSDRRIGKPPVRVAAGEKCGWGAGGFHVVQADLEVETAWRDGRLMVRDRPLSEVVAAFNRYSADRLSIEDRAAGAKPISGSFRYDGGREFALALATGFDLSVKRTSDGVWRIRTPEGSTTVR